MNIDVDGSLEKWLRQQLTARGHGLTGRRLLLDVGAYHGDFAATYLSVPESGFDRAILFEPNPANFNFLGQQFAAAVMAFEGSLNTCMLWSHSTVRMTRGCVHKTGVLENT